MHTDSSNINTLLIGAGPHALNVYLPAIASNAKQWKLQIVGVVDFSEQLAALRSAEYFGDVSRSTDFIAAPPRPKGSAYALTTDFRNCLSAFVRDHEVRAVIVATDPFSHMAYIEWALNEGLNILVDKPITLHPYASVDPIAASRIEEDYRTLVTLADGQRDRLTGEPLVFECLIQRRYQEAFWDMREVVNRVYMASKCPLTSITIIHNDGQFRLPDELMSVAYHGFEEGVGKLSHTGYHFLDLLPWFLTACQPTQLTIDSISVQAHFVRPRDIAKVLHHSNAGYLLNRATCWSNDDDLRVERYGEVDANLIIAFRHGNTVVCSATLVLLHSGLSFRYWGSTGDDQLVNKGRMKQETIIMHQGPFLSVQYHKYRALKGPGSEHSEFGGEHHNEVNYLVNTKLLPGKWDRVVQKRYPHSVGSLSIPGYKLRCIEHFVRRLRGLDVLSPEDTAGLTSYASGVRLLASAYVAGARGYLGQSPVYEGEFSL